MNKLTTSLLAVVISGCAAQEKVKPKPYDNPREGYIVYTPKAEIQSWDGIYLSGFHSTGYQYLNNCTATSSSSKVKQLQGYLRYNEKDGVVYLKYNGGPTYFSCDIAYDTIKIEVESYLNNEKELATQANIADNERREKLKLTRQENPKASATQDAIGLFVQYCELLKNATGNASRIDHLRSMRHEFIGPTTNVQMYQYALNAFRNSGGRIYCESVIPQIKESMYSSQMDPRK